MLGTVRNCHPPSFRDPKSLGGLELRVIHGCVTHPFWMFTQPIQLFTNKKFWHREYFPLKLSRASARSRIEHARRAPTTSKKMHAGQYSPCRYANKSSSPIPTKRREANGTNIIIRVGPLPGLSALISALRFAE